MITKVNTNIRKHLHSSRYFNGTDAVHEGGLLAVCSGHEVLHVCGYGPRFAREVWLVEDHNLQTHNGSDNLYTALNHFQLQWSKGVNQVKTYSVL